MNKIGGKSLKKLNIESIEDFLSFDDTTYVIGQNIVDWKEDPANRQLLDNLLDVLTITQTKKQEEGEVCMTGSGPATRSLLVKKLEEMGYSVSSSVTKSTVLLLCDNPDGSSSKLKKARAEGVPIQTYNDFFGDIFSSDD